MAIAALPPGPRGSFLLGSVSEFQRDTLGFLTRCAREYGDVVPIRFGPALLILLNDPALIEQVLVTDHRRFIKSRGVRALSSLIGNGLVLNEGESWLQQRRLIQPAFHRERLAGYGETMVRVAQRMLDTWQDGEERLIDRDMTLLTQKVATETLFGTDLGEEAPEIAKVLTAAGAAMSARMSSLMLLLPDSVPTPNNRRLRRAVREADTYIYRIIERRRRSDEERDDLLSLLLHAQDADDGSRMSDQQLRDEVMTFFTAGHETTANTLIWTWYLLSGHSAALDALEAEIREVLGDRPPTVADLPRLRYADMVISESLRLYPPAAVLGREAIVDCTIGGYPIHRGNAVMMSQWVTQRDARYFDQPEAFMPERWADGLARRIPRFAYFPFGGGPRQCIGNQFATMEAVLVLVTIAQRVRLHAVPGHRIWPYMMPTLRLGPSLPMVVECRAAS